MIKETLLNRSHKFSSAGHFWTKDGLKYKSGLRADVAVHVPIWVLFLKHTYSSVTVKYVFPIESYERATDSPRFQEPRLTYHRALTPPPYFLITSYSSIVPLSDWVWKSLCNFVQSDVLDILLYISVNKMWTNCSVLSSMSAAVEERMKNLFECLFGINDDDE